MKILIMSDTHGYDGNMWNAIRREEPIDMFVHCGDIEHMPTELKNYLDCPVHIVRGNNDFMLKLPDTDRFRIADYEVLLTHGHRYNIYRNQDAMFYLGKENNADIVMFGHIHSPVIARADGVTIVNPGSISLPRQADGRPTYIIMNAESGREPEYIIKRL
jgi:hypothetical protein